MSSTKKANPFDKDELSKIAGFNITEEFASLWEEFVLSRSTQAKTRIKTKASEERIFKRLLGMSNSILKIKYILIQTIDRGWLGFFDLTDEFKPLYNKEKQKDYVQVIKVDKPDKISDEKRKELSKKMREIGRATLGGGFEQRARAIRQREKEERDLDIKNKYEMENVK